MSISKNKPLIFIIAILLVTNIALLVFFLNYSKPSKAGEKGTRGGMVSAALKKDVGFSDEQISEYKKMKEEQFKTMRPIMDDIRKSKDSLFRLLGSATAEDSTVDQLAGDIAMKQKEMDLLAFAHFKRIRTLCTPDQLPKYDSMVVKMIRKMGKGRQQEKPKN